LKKKDLVKRQAEDDIMGRELEPTERGRGGDPVEAASGPNMEVEEDEWLPPPAGSDDDEEGNEWLPPPPGSDDDDEMKLSGKEHGLRIGEPLELIAQDLVEAQALEKKPARQRYPALPQWMFTGAGRLKAAAPEWKPQEGVTGVRLGARILTEEQEAGYTLAYETIMNKSFFHRPAGTEARGSASSC